MMARFPASKACLCAAMAFCCLALVQPAARAQETIDALLDQYPFTADWSKNVVDKRMEIAAKLLTRGQEVKDYLEGLFDPEKDPLLGKVAPVPEDQRKQLYQRRQVMVWLLRMADDPNSWTKTYLERILLSLPVPQRAEAKRLLDTVCEEQRLRVFSRLGNVADERLRKDILECIVRTEDLRFMEAVLPLLGSTRVEEKAQALRLVSGAAGQRDRMRSFLDPKAHGYAAEVAAAYAHKVGDDAFAAQALLPHSRDRTDAAAFGTALRGLAVIDTKEARDTVLKVLQTEPQKSDLFGGVAWRLPPFFAQERLPIYLKYYGPQYSADHLLDWLREHGSDAGLDMARRCVAAEHPNGFVGEYEVERYLLAFGDEATARRVREKMNVGHWNSVSTEIGKAIRVGRWDLLPENIEALASFRTAGPPTDGLRKILTAAEENPHRSLLPILRTAAKEETLELRARTLLLSLGERDVAPRLKELIVGERLADCVPAMAALFRAGEADQCDELLRAAKASWLPATLRIQALRALAAAPQAARKPLVPLRSGIGAERRALDALCEALLDPDGRVSQAASEALRAVSGLKDVKFHPWETDAVRRTQAKPFLAWVQDWGQLKGG